MRPDLTRHVVLICCTILVAVKPCFSEERRKYNDFFHQLEEIKAAWRRYQELMHYPNCTVTTTTTDVTGNIRSVLVDHYKSRLDCTLVHNVVVQNNLDLQSDVERVSCYNLKYYFTLIKRNQTGDYAIKHIAFSEEDARPILEPIRQEDYYVRNVLLMLNRHAMLAQIVEQSFFKVNNVDFFEHNGQRLLRLRFDSSHDIIAMAREKKQRPLFVQAGTVVLDPNRFWTIREAHIEARYLNVSTREECEVTVTADGGGVPLPQCRKIRQTFFYDGKAEPVTFLSEERFDWRGLTEERDLNTFTLSAFGLPEPPGVTWERPTPWWLYGILAGFALVILSGILYKITARWRTPVAKPQNR